MHRHRQHASYQVRLDDAHDCLALDRALAGGRTSRRRTQHTHLQPQEAEIFLKHPDVKGVSFVGSTPVGLHIYSTAAAHGKRVQALCEAKNHGLVMEDAALERSARGIINSSFGCAGERCMALPVIVAQESIADELVALLCSMPKN